MQWDEDDYKDLKWMIFDLLRDDLFDDHKDKITVQMLTDSIDNLFKALIKDE